MDFCLCPWQRKRTGFIINNLKKTKTDQIHVVTAVSHWMKSSAGPWSRREGRPTSRGGSAWASYREQVSRERGPCRARWFPWTERLRGRFREVKWLKFTGREYQRRDGESMIEGPGSLQVLVKSWAVCQCQEGAWGRWKNHQKKQVEQSWNWYRPVSPVVRAEKDSASHNMGGMDTFLERHKLPKLT